MTLTWGKPTVLDIRRHAQAHPAHDGWVGQGPTLRRLDVGGLWLVRAAGGARCVRVGAGGLDGTGLLRPVGSSHPMVVLEAAPLTADGEPAPWPIASQPLSPNRAADSVAP